MAAVLGMQPEATATGVGIVLLMADGRAGLLFVAARGVGMLSTADAGEGPALRADKGADLVPVAGVAVRIRAGVGLRAGDASLLEERVCREGLSGGQAGTASC